jgi:hypothetical protein
MEYEVEEKKRTDKRVSECKIIYRKILCRRRMYACNPRKHQAEEEHSQMEKKKVIIKREEVKKLGN